MTLRRAIGILCPITCVACLAAGFAGTGQWAGLAGVLLVALAWLPAGKRESGGWPAVALALSTAVAAAGLLAGAAPFAMILGATLALAGWDLALFNRALPGDSGSSARAVALFERRHYAGLALALGPALLIAVAGRWLRLEIPLGIVALFVVLALYGLDRAWRAVSAA